MALKIGAIAIAALMLGTAPVQKVFLGTTQIWANEVVVVLGDSGTSTYLASLFDADVWLSDTPKRVVIPEGVERGSTWNWVLAPIASAAAQADSWGGELVLENRGTISGSGGSANSGTGGTGIIMTKNGRDGQSMIINNYGTIRAGGGGGGLGGNGGGGYYTYSDYQRTPASGTQPYGRYSYNMERYANGSNCRLFWGGSNLGDHAMSGGDYLDLSGWRYYCVSVAEVYNNYYGYSIFRQLITPTTGTAYTSGGAGGAGGRGQGYGVAALAGSGGSAGGTNAGAGGTGGAGASWGATGSTGNTGSSGNNGAGAAGAVGGLGGYYLNGSDKAVLNNFGTVLGRLN